MTIETRLIGKQYDINSDPLPNPETEHGTTNCRRTAQLFYYLVYNALIPPEEILSAESYGDTRSVVWQNNDFSDITPETFPDVVVFGDLLHTEKRNGKIPKGRGSNKWKKRLHLAVCIGKAGSEQAQKHFPSLANYDPSTVIILHASLTVGQSALSPLSEFLEAYNPVRATRIPERLATK